MTTPIPLWEAVDQYQAALGQKLGAFLMWLQELEVKLDAAGIFAVIQVQYESPFTTGGPFAQVPKAIVAGTVLYRGFLRPTEQTGKGPERRAMTLGIQSMQITPDPAVAAKRILHNLTWYSKPEADLLPS